MLFLFLQNEENWSFDDEPFKQLRYKARDLIFRKKKKKKKKIAWAFGWLVLASFLLPVHHLLAIRFSFGMRYVCIFMDRS